MASSKGRGWNLLIVPEDESKIRQYRVPRGLAISVLVFGIVLFVYAIAETVLFWSVAREASQVQPLKQEVQRLQHAGNRLAVMTEELTRLQSFEQQIRRVLSRREGDTLEAVPWSSTELAAQDFDLGVESNFITEDSWGTIGVTAVPERAAFSAGDIPTLPPLRGYVTQRFAPGSLTKPATHLGLDVAAHEGTPVLAAADGLVVFSEWTYRYGNLVILVHQSGYTTFYGHNQVLFHRPGDYIRQGEPVALSGNSGRSTAPHLHFEVWYDGKPVDPMSVLQTTP